MNIQQFMEAVSCRVCGGSEFQWSCYPNSRYMDISDLDGNEVGSCIFSTISQEVYEIAFYVSDDDVAYRWTDSLYESARDDEANIRGVNPDQAYDDVMFTDINSEEEILKISRDIVHMTYVHFHPLKEEKDEEVV